MIQVYTGNGKGKTTAALGLALRAAGAGLKVYICQFLKGRYCCELASLKKLKNIKVRQFGSKCFVMGKSFSERDKELASRGLEAANQAIKANKYDMVILDEINVALKHKALQLDKVIALLKNTPQKIELILTGRNAHPAIVKIADLVSEIKDNKHYFKKGVMARKGIEF